MGQTGRFFAQLALLLRQGVAITDALELMASDAATPEAKAGLRRMHARISAGEFLHAALAELPEPFDKEILRLVQQMESEGLLLEQLEALGCWPDPGLQEPGPLLARVFAHASIFVRRGIPMGEALWLASRASDPEPLKAALKAVSKADGVQETMSGTMARYPEYFGEPVVRIVRLIEPKGDAEATCRRLAQALSQGWFPPRSGDVNAIGVLEDDVDGRQPQFREALESMGSDVKVVLHDNAPDFIAWLGRSYEGIRLLSLDHDLVPPRGRAGTGVVSGSGMDVVDALVRLAPSFPIVVHTSNPYSGPTMVRRLEEAGWSVQRIVPWGEEWIPTVWLATVRKLLGTPAAPEA